MYIALTQIAKSFHLSSTNHTFRVVYYTNREEQMPIAFLHNMQMLGKCHKGQANIDTEFLLFIQEIIMITPFCVHMLDRNIMLTFAFILPYTMVIHLIQLSGD